ncbi:hypothetical protein [Lyngbya aestuarii]|uniref:hypothetical protein n=1 Tax=Lyngbya aestuarii TaxID=118322 RepID=UPI00403E2847
MTSVSIEPELQQTQTIFPQKTDSKLSSSPSVCRCCQFYKTQGRNGGQCQKLGVPVSGQWCSCTLALLPFAASWQVDE